MYKNNILVEVKGKNVYEFLKRIFKLKINLLEIHYIDIHTLELLISNTDYEKLKDMKTTYTFEIKKIYGMNLILFKIKKHAIFILAFLLSIFFLLFLTSRITEVEIIHSDKNLRELIFYALKNQDIKEHSFIKKYSEIEKIKKNILEEYKDKIEWLEIKRVGTKYVVRIEERIIPSKKEELENSHIVSSSHAIIKSIEATKGDIVKNINDYVKPGDILISGEIKLNEEVKQYINATGIVFGEVWYHVTSEYPYNYEEVIETGKKHTIYTFSFLSKKIEFTLHPYKEKKSNIKPILKHNLFPIFLSKEEQKEVMIKKENLTKEEAIKKALEEIEKKIKESLKEKEYIISIKKLKVEENNSKIILEAFVSVYKNIGVSKKIEVSSEE